MAYHLFNPPLGKEIDEMSGKELGSFFDWFLGQIPSRVSELEHVVRSANGYANWSGNRKPTSLKELGRWLISVAEDERLSGSRLAVKKTGPLPVQLISDRDLTIVTHSLCVDVGIYLGEVVIARCPQLFWHMRTKGKSMADFGRPTIAGSDFIPADPANIAANMAYDAVEGKGHHSYLWTTYLMWTKHARKWCD